MWLQILTDGTRTEAVASLRTFAIGSKNGVINQTIITEFHLQGLTDLLGFDKFVADNLGQPVEYETELEGLDTVVYFKPNSPGGIKFVGASIVEDRAMPNEVDWAAMSAKLMRMYESEFDEVSEHHRFIQNLGAELREEIERCERKVAFFRDTNPAKHAEMFGRIETLRRIQARLNPRP